MSKFSSFNFEGYEFNKSEKTLLLHYSYDGELEFSDKYHFDFDFADYDEKALDRAIQILFFMAGVSYYKMYLAVAIIVNAGHIDARLASFLNKTYLKGLGELLYINKLNPRMPVDFPVNSADLEPIEINSNGSKLIGIGGGKDSLVSVEFLEDTQNLASWSLNHRPKLEPLISRIGLKHFWVDRALDPKIAELNKLDAYNGHIPISAIFSCVGAVVSILTGYRDNVVSNESSANEPNLSYEGIDINHQYSKSLEFEKDFQDILKHNFGDSIRYYSLLRPFSELRIAEFFARKSFNKYKDVFCSCNRAFASNNPVLKWCGECAKCAFVFLALTPFIDRAALEKVWEGKNLLLDPALESMYRKILGIEGDKPLDCVGEVKEARAAMRLAQKIYPELSKYIFDIPETYDYKSWSTSCMPEELLSYIKDKTKT